MINNFGQTPCQLFKKPHPVWITSVNNSLSLGYYILQDNLKILTQSITPLKGI
jgi:hypothetical protein